MAVKAKKIKLTLKNLDKYRWILEQPYASLLSHEMDLEKYCYFTTLHETARKNAPELGFFNNTDYDDFIVKGYALLNRLGKKYEEVKMQFKDVHLNRLTTRNYIFQWDIYTKVSLVRRFLKYTDIHEEEAHQELSIITDLMDDRRMFGFEIKNLNGDNFNPILPVLISTVVLDAYFIDAFKIAFPKTFDEYGEEVLTEHYHNLLDEIMEKTAVEVINV